MGSKLAYDHVSYYFTREQEDNYRDAISISHLSRSRGPTTPSLEVVWVVLSTEAVELRKIFNIFVFVFDITEVWEVPFDL